MEFLKKDGKYSKLSQKNVDTGLGLERMTMLLEGKKTPFETELFAPVMEKLVELQKVDSIEARRIVAEHLRASVMIIADGGRPSNVDRGYILRRLLRRMTRYLNKLDIDLTNLPELVSTSINSILELYPELEAKKQEITEVIVLEKDKFVKTLKNGEREFDKVAQRAKAQGKDVIETESVFKLFETYGFPPEMTEELAHEHGLKVDMSDYQRLFKEHQDKSRLGSDQKFKGGLASSGEMETKYHTATHLLNAALKVVIGKDSHQRGSNITEERMRFDFNCDHKLTEEEKKAVEDLVNKWIEEDLPVTFETVKKEDAVKSGAECMFIEKYPDDVTVYTIGDVSKEICGGPHVTNTGVLGHFKIKKEEASSAGIRRIKAVLE
jgi:alanyl-tRNA synthetase